MLDEGGGKDLYSFFFFVATESCQDLNYVSMYFVVPVVYPFFFASSVQLNHWI